MTRYRLNTIAMKLHVSVFCTAGYIYRETKTEPFCSQFLSYKVCRLLYARTNDGVILTEERGFLLSRKVS